MKIRHIFSIAIVVLGARCFAATATDKEAAFSVTGKNLAALNGMPIKVYLPATLPADYLLFDYSLKDELKKSDVGSPNYSVMFLRDKAHWFQIESSDTVGDLVSDWKTTNSKSETFGKFSVQWTSEVSPGEPIKTPHVISTWLHDPESTKAKDSNRSERFYRLIGRGLSAEEAVNILKSLKLKN